eukprot:2681857-Rhodomonas_salina.1
MSASRSGRSAMRGGQRGREPQRRRIARAGSWTGRGGRPKAGRRTASEQCATSCSRTRSASTAPWPASTPIARPRSPSGIACG